MTPKEKALEVVKRICITFPEMMYNDDAIKDAALVGIEEIIRVLGPCDATNYWNNVKDEIRKL
jgi:hypothetical protein